MGEGHGCLPQPSPGRLRRRGSSVPRRRQDYAKVSGTQRPARSEAPNHTPVPPDNSVRASFLGPETDRIDDHTRDSGESPGA